MDILTKKELLVDALEDGRPTILINGKELTQLALFISVYNDRLSGNDSESISYEEMTSLLILIAKQSTLTPKDCLRLASLNDNQMATVFIENSKSIENTTFNGGLSALIKKCRFDAATKLISRLENQNNSSHKDSSYTAAICQAGNTLSNQGGNTDTAQKRLIGLLNTIKWDSNELVSGKALIQHFFDFNLPTVYDHLSREMASRIKDEFRLDSEQALADAGQSVDVRGIL